MDNEISQIYNPEEEHVPIPIRILEFYLVEGPKDHGWSAERESPKHVFNQNAAKVSQRALEQRRSEEHTAELDDFRKAGSHLFEACLDGIYDFLRVFDVAHHHDAAESFDLAIELGKAIAR